MITPQTRSPISYQALWLRWTFLTLFLGLLLAAPLTLQAQGEVATIEQLEVQLWPDFDRPSVLASLMGFLPSGTPGPVTITLPVPESASVHVVSPLREDGQPGPEMSYDDSVPGQLTFTAEMPGFYVEYYYPYTADGNGREFSFTWQSDMTVDQILTVVQQPIMSSDLTTNPGSEAVTTGSDGLQYHRLPLRSVPAGTVYLLEGDYSLVRPQLTQDVLAEGQNLPSDGTETGGAEEAGLNWLLIMAIAAGVAAVVVVAWLLFGNRRRRQRVTRPRPARRSGAQPRPRARSAAPPPVQSKGIFCHECGQPLEPDDRFCRNCGSAVKNVG
jgi:hypothetical protein